MINKVHQRQRSESSSTNAIRRIVSSLLGEIVWESDGTCGYCKCPGSQQHHSRTGKHDTRIYVNQVPTVVCFHTSCSATLDATNWRLRSAIGQHLRGRNSYIERSGKSAVQIAHERKKLEAAQLAASAGRALPRILEEYHWPLADIYHSSPITLGAVSDDWRWLLSLFAPSDVVWIGGKYHSGTPDCAHHFRTASKWLELSTCPEGPHVSPFAYLPETYSRKAKYALARRFMVIESDSLHKEHQGAVLRWMRDAVGLRLRAIVDTAAKSIHGWFEAPDVVVMQELDSVIRALKCDPALLRPSQVSRLPSCWREGKTQKLLYFDNEGGFQ